MLKKRFLSGFLAVVTAMTIIGVNLSSTYGSIGTNVPIYNNISTSVQKVALDGQDIKAAFDSWDNFSRVMWEVLDYMKDAYDLKENFDQLRGWVEDIRNTPRESEIGQIIKRVEEIIYNPRFQDTLKYEIPSSLREDFNNMHQRILADVRRDWEKVRSRQGGRRRTNY